MRLIIVRKLRGYSQEQLAAESGIARSHVSAIERGKINISLNKIGQIAQTLSVDPRELMDFDSETVSELNEGDEVPESPIEAVDPESSSFQ
jgi:transcriptional regulator with XRE-family HTH domain